MKIKGYIVDVECREIYFGAVEVVAGRIAMIGRCDDDEDESQSVGYILPGFVDSHVHIESSMLTPENFGRAVISCGTVAVVTDPHEIANVLGVEGVEFMVKSSESSPIKTFFTIPSSVPATPFDRSGGVVTSCDVEQLAASGRFVGLSEMMNVPGVLGGDSEVVAKLESAKRYGLAVDGHAPMLMGEELLRYVSCGITTDHECSTLEEAQAKIAAGMKIEIREGSAAKNYEALKPLIATAPESLLFCTDDSHPDEILSSGHIDKIVRRAVADGFDLFDVLRIASINPVTHYSLSCGVLRVGDTADFIVVDNLSDFKTHRVYIDGELRYDIDSDSSQVVVDGGVEINNFHHDLVERSELSRAVECGERLNLIGVVDGELITSLDHYVVESAAENFESDVEADLVKIVYINRYFNTPPVVAYCRGFGLRNGAFASSIAHDSHNITAVGVTDEEIIEAINAVIESRGALAVVHSGDSHLLPLPIAGIMSDRSACEVAQQYDALQREIASMGCKLSAPFMTLSFLSLVVIPEVKIGEQGLFSYSSFDWI